MSDAHVVDFEEEINENINLQWLEKLSGLEKDYNVDDALIQYLQRVNLWMKSKTTKDILKQLPSIGKLLSALSKLSIQLPESGALAKAVLEGVLNLSKLPSSLHHASSSNTEKKAAEWAINQLQFLTCPSIAEDESSFIDQFDITMAEITKAQLEEVSCLIADIVGNKSYDVCEMQSKSKMLYEISHSVAPLVNEPDYRNIVELLLLSTEMPFGHYSFDTKKMENSVCKEFLIAISKNKGLVEGLSYRSTVCLWKCYMPAFETEVFNLLEIVLSRKNIDERSLFVLVSSREKLINACSENMILANYAFDIIREALSRLGGMCCLMSLVNVFYICIRKRNIQSVRSTPNTAVVKSLLSFTVEISELSLKNSEKAVMFIAEELKTLVEENCQLHTIWFELVKNLHWVFESSLLSLTSSTSCIDSCLVVLSVFYFLRVNPDVLKTFKSFILNLRCLLTKRILQFSDIKCLVESCTHQQQQQHDIKPMPLIRDLMLVFLVLAEGSHFVLRESFSLVTDGLSYECKLDLLLRTLERLFSSRVKLQMPSEKKETFLLFLKCLSDRALGKNKASEQDQTSENQTSIDINNLNQDLRERTLKCTGKLKDAV